MIKAALSGVMVGGLSNRGVGGGGCLGSAERVFGDAASSVVSLYRERLAWHANVARL